MRKTLIIAACAIFSSCATDSTKTTPIAPEPGAVGLSDDAGARLEAYVALEAETVAIEELAARWDGEDCHRCIGSTCGEPEDGEIRLTASSVGNLVQVTAWMRNISAWWLDLDWAGCDFPGIPPEELPIVSVAAVGVDFWYEPLEAIAGAVADGWQLKADIPWTMAAWNWFPPDHPSVPGMTRMGAFIVPQPCPPIPGCAYLLEEDTWYRLGIATFELAPDYEGTISFFFGDTVDDVYDLGKSAEPAKVTTRRPTIMRAGGEGFDR